MSGYPRLRKSDRAYIALQEGLPWGWQRFVCRGCGADYVTRHQAIIYDPCGNCGTHVGEVTNVRVTYA